MQVGHFLDRWLYELHFEKISVPSFVADQAWQHPDKVLVMVVEGVNPTHSIPVQWIQQYLMHLHEKSIKYLRFHAAQFEFKKEIILSKIYYLLHQSTSIYARMLSVKRIHAAEAMLLTEKWHIQGFVGGKYHLALTDPNGEYLALASFSRKLLLTRETPKVYSAQLIRYCVRPSFHIPGALSKLIRHFNSDFNVQHLMSYIDMDYGMGDGFLKIGFELKAIKAPQKVDPKTKLGSKPNQDGEHYYNGGSLKLILHSPSHEPYF